MEDHQFWRLEDQLSFPLYACSREVVKAYRPYLDELGLTYTQYISMLVLWEQGKISVKDLGTKLDLDSGTLTPLLKKLESKGYLVRKRSQQDERVVIAYITEKGRDLQKTACRIPLHVDERLAGFPVQKLDALRTLLFEFMMTLNSAQKTDEKK